jgi:hypothetical protein
MTEIETRVADLINFSSNQKPVDFEDSFKAIMQSRVAAAIETKKQEIAQAMFNNPSNDIDIEDESEAEDHQDLETDNEEQEETEDQEDGETA